jgi:hypothetical protein
MAKHGAPIRPTPRKQDQMFWENLQVYPAAVGQGDARERFRAKAVDAITKLPLSNVKNLCDRLNVKHDDGEDLTSGLASSLMRSQHGDTLTYLNFYLGRRVSYVTDFFSRHFPLSDAQRIQAEVADRSMRRNDTIKPLTKLICIYLARPADLKYIHHDFVWRRGQTYSEFGSSETLPADTAERLHAAIDQLIKSLGQIRKGETYRFFGLNPLRPGLRVFVLYRNFQAAVKPDHQRKYRVQYDYSTCVFGLDNEEGCIRRAAKQYGSPGTLSALRIQPSSFYPLSSERRCSLASLLITGIDGLHFHSTGVCRPDDHAAGGLGVRRQGSGPRLVSTTWRRSTSKSICLVSSRPNAPSVCGPTAKSSFRPQDSDRQGDPTTVGTLASRRPQECTLRPGRGTRQPFSGSFSRASRVSDKPNVAFQ